MGRTAILVTSKEALQQLNRRLKLLSFFTAPWFRANWLDLYHILFLQETVRICGCSERKIFGGNITFAVTKCHYHFSYGEISYIRNAQSTKVYPPVDTGGDAFSRHFFTYILRLTTTLCHPLKGKILVIIPAT